MEVIRQRQHGEQAEVKLRGRLDAYSANEVGREFNDLIAAGAQRVWVDCSEVEYVSSLGIGLLMRLHKQLKGLGGAFIIHSPSKPVTEVLELSRLAPMLVGPPPDPQSEAN